MRRRDSVGTPERDLDAACVCHRCIGEAYLSAEIRRAGVRRRCTYCDKSGRSYEIAQVADRVESAFEQHYRRTAENPDAFQSAMMADRESPYSWDRAGDPTAAVIGEVLEAEEEVANDVQAVLGDRHFDFEGAKMGEESEFAAEAHYDEIDIDDAHWREQWDEFERSLTTEARFFSRGAMRHLKAVFEGLEGLKTHDGRPVIVDAGPKAKLKSFHRARVFQSPEALLDALTRPDLHIGTPPADRAVAGRMNAGGIAVFYGASSASVATTEVRPPVGSDVAVAQFDVVRPLRLLDLTALETAVIPGSVFDPDWVDALARLTFLRSLGLRLARPVMPDDEAFQYLPTQAIADFLATANSPPLDGIIFPSVQAGSGRNVVLFHKAARVEALPLPEGTELEARDGYETPDGWEPDYTVVEEVPVAAAANAAPRRGIISPDADFDTVVADAVVDSRPVTLRVNLESVEVHSIQHVEFTVKSYDVRRTRWTRRPGERDDF